MIKIALGVVVGVLMYHYYPAEVKGAAEKTAEIVHKGASVIAEETKPKSELEKFTEKFK